MLSLERYSRGKADEIMFMLIICEKFGWGYDEFLSQPVWFIDALRQKMIVDNKRDEMAAKRNRIK